MEAVPKQVLVIDDDQDCRDLLVEILSTAGFSAVAAENGSDALEKLCASTPSLIIVDLMMPVMDGATFRRRQLLDPALSKIPTIVLSASHGSLRPPEFRGLVVLSKPVAVERLLQVARDCCACNDG